MPEPATVAFVVSRWGAATQTFVRREAAALAAAGLRVTAFSLKRPEPCGSEVPTVWLPPIPVARGFVRAALRHPLVCTRLLSTLVRRSSRANLTRQLAAVAAGVAWATRQDLRSTHLHAHFGWVAATSAWAAAAISGRPYSVVLHAFELHDRRMVDGFTPVPLRAAERVFTISERDRAVVADRWGIDAAVVRMGVPRHWLEATGDGRDDWTVVSVGALLPKKGHEVLLEAVTRADPRWRLVIVGTGPLRSALDERIAELGLAGRVQLVGLKSEEWVREALRTAAVSCLASVETAEGDRDGIPVCLIEAMATGAPVIGTDVGAVGELLDGAGLIVPSGDPDALAVALDSLRDPETRASIGAAGRARVREQFVAEDVAAPVIELARATLASAVEPETVLVP